VSGQICVSEGETVAASVRNCAIVSAINMSHETDDGEPTICIYAGKHPGAVQAVRESRLRGQRPPHLPGSRAPDEWLHDAARAVDGSAIVRPLRAALRCTGGGVDGRRAIAASHSPLHTTGLLYAIVPWRDIILSPTLRGWKRSLNAYHHACIPPGTRNGGRWKTMGSNLTAPRRRRCPSTPSHGLFGAQGARTDDAGVGRLREGQAGPGERNESPASLWSVILGWEDWAVGSRVPKGAAPPPLGCAEDTQKSLLASAGELRSEQNGRVSGRGRGYARREAGLRELNDLMGGEFCSNYSRRRQCVRAQSQ
jgi:hypothetical protein